MRVFISLAFLALLYMFNMVSAQEYITLTAYSDANCSADGRLFGYYFAPSLYGSSDPFFVQGVASCNNFNNNPAT